MAAADDIDTRPPDEPPTRVRAAQYVRMSTDHQRYSTENQSEAIQHRWPLSMEYSFASLQPRGSTACSSAYAAGMADYSVPARKSPRRDGHFPAMADRWRWI